LFDNIQQDIITRIFKLDKIYLITNQLSLYILSVKFYLIMLLQNILKKIVDKIRLMI